MNHQADRLARRDFDWLLLADAMRADVFEDLHQDHLAGDYHRVHNGGHRATPHWFDAHFGDHYDAMLFHGGQPIHGIKSNPPYDERAHFRAVPYYGLYEWDARLQTVPPDEVNRVVRAHLPDGLDMAGRLEALGYAEREATLEFDFAIVRYLQPHVPYRSAKAAGLRGQPTIRAAERGDLDLPAAYRDNARWVLEHIAELVADLPGRVAVTADHGDCLGDCGQWLHEPGNALHDHLVEVPWLADATPR